MPKLPRRVAILHAFEFVCAGAALALLPRRARAELACVDPSSESLRESLNYTDPSPNPDEKCGVCAFFTPDSESSMSCGYCQIMTGPVHATSRCDSWSPRS